MTWNEFKELVDGVIKAHDKDGSITVSKIDVYLPTAGSVRIRTLNFNEELYVTDRES